MSAPTIYTNGGGGTTGDEVAVNKPVYVLGGGHIWYVYSGTGVDAASPRGREREKPLATLGQAITNSVSGDVIIFLPNHAETIAGALTTGAKALTIVSEGTGSSRARLTCNAAIAMITLAATGSSLNNIYFPASTGAAPTTRVDVTAAGVISDNCYFECGALDTNRTYRLQASSCQLTNAYFLATASQPAVAVEVTPVTNGTFIEDVTFDGGSFGFSDFAFKAIGALQGIYANNVSQLNNADVSIPTGSSGVWIPGTTSASARIEAV